MRHACVFAMCATLLACSSETPADGVPVDLSPLGGERPVEPIVPDDFDPTVPTPLLIMLHGYGASGLSEDIILKIDTQVNERGFIYLRPDGTFDSMDHRFWNATDACCNFDGVELDDVDYIQGLIDEAKARYTIDHVALLGHSNGGFMSHRFACDRPSSIDAFASLAGMTWLDPSQCHPDGPVRALQIHGTEDMTVQYDGMATVMYGSALYPGAVETAARWAMYNGCAPTPETDADRDYSPDAPGAETTVSRYGGCMPGAAAELWTLQGEGHLPNVNDAWRHDVLDFLLE